MDSCIYDVCSNTEDNKAMKELSCSSMTAMARECESLKVPIDDWMTLHGCCVYYLITIRLIIRIIIKRGILIMIITVET